MNQLTHPECVSLPVAPSVWLERLLEAATPSAVALVIVDMLESMPGVGSATVLWWLHGASVHESRPIRRLTAAELQLAQLAQHSDRLQSDPDQHLVALRLCRPDPAVLLLRLEVAETDLPRSPLLRLASRQLQRTLDLLDLQHSHNQLERSENLQRALFAISDLAGADLDMPEMLLGIHGIVSTLMYAENFYIVRYAAERDAMRFLYYADVEDTEQPALNVDVALGQRRHSLTWYLIRDGHALMGNVEELQEQVSGPLSVIGPVSDDWLGVPMLREGRVGGALVVQAYEKGVRYSVEDRALLQFVGSHILTALERKQDKDDLERRVRERTLELAKLNQGLKQEVEERQRAERLQAALFHMAQLATADIDQQAFYRQVHAIVGELINAQNFYIALLNDDGSAVSFPYAVDLYDESYPTRPLGRGLSEYVLVHGPQVLDEAGMRAMAADGLIDLPDVGALSLCWLGVPLREGERAIGLVAVQSYTELVTYGAAEQELLGFVASQIANSLQRRRVADSLQRAYAQLEQRVEERTQALRKEIGERERMQQQLHHQVMHDPLTGLPNRDHLRGRLEQSLAVLHSEPARRCALLYIDVDRFKIINDSLGHLAGDKVLREVAARLLTCVRHPDVVARLSGDEFAILLEHVTEPAHASRVAQRVLDALALPLQVAGKELQLSASLGIAIGDHRYHSADELLRDADMALYRAKQLGRKRYELFDDTLAKNVIDELTMEAELRQAMQRDEFEPYLQPISHLDTGEVVGYEALIRWNHPQRGVLAPGAFLKVAEDSGHIEKIDWRLFELACEKLGQLADKQVFITLNISALHLRHADFDRRLIQLLERTGLPPQRVIAEVTEGSLLDDPERVRDILGRLRSAGVGAALDDFGTGYSSLSYLHSLPLRKLKIDRAFVQVLDEDSTSNSSTVVRAILALARALNIQVIAEGIETEVQRRVLRDMGCELGQGFLLDRPAPIGHWLALESASAAATL
jgi:diguanylate cyclase (GGDEF)-like protein